MADTKISAAADITTLVGTDMLPVARSASTTAYHATMTEVGAFANANLVTASTTTLGGVKVDGTTITIAGGVISGAGGPTPSSSVPNMDGVGAAGTAPAYSRGDHVHPINTSLAPLASPALTGSPTAPTVTPATDSTTKLATTAFVQSAMSAAGAGVSSWNTRTGAVSLLLSDVTGVGGAPLASPTFTGDARAVTPAYGDNDTSIATSAFVQAAVAPTYDNVGRNLIHNPLMAIAQRGAGPWTTAGAYTLDRWVIQQTTDTVSFGASTLTDAARAQIGDEAAIQALNNNFTGNAAAGAMSAIEQRIERVSRLSGKTVTVSFWAVAGTGGLRLGTNIYQVFGSGGSPSAAVIVLATGNAVTLTTSWARYSFTATMPSDAGKTFGTNGDDSTFLRFFYSSGATNNAQAGNIGVQAGAIALWGIQLEIGSVATPLDYGGTPADQLRQCQRFYQVGQLTLTGNATATSQLFGIGTPWPVSMRATPTAAISTNGLSGVIGSPALGTNAYSISLQGTSTGAGAFNLNVVYTASADL